MLQHPIQTQAIPGRLKNFSEVNQGFSKKNALLEARRCLQCSDPVCRTACPLNIDIPAFIRNLREGDFTSALDKIHEENCLPSVCGRTCPAPCEKACILKKDGEAIAIRALERFAADHGKSFFAGTRKGEPPSGKRIAVIGSGPAGMTAASFLLKAGYRVTIFEAYPFIGGVMNYAIPELRLPASVVAKEFSALKGKGLEIFPNKRFGQNFTLPELRAKGFIAIVLALGSGGYQPAKITGENLGGVCYAEEFLFKFNTIEVHEAKRCPELHRGSSAIVIGSGNKALDAARLCLRLKKKVRLIFPGTDDDLLVHPEDLKEAQAEGVELVGLSRVNEIIANDQDLANRVRCDRLDFADADGTGKWVLLPVPDSQFTLPGELIILAEGTRANQEFSALFPEVSVTEKGGQKMEPKFQSAALSGVFLAGALVDSTFFIVDAMASGKKTAQAVGKFMG